MRKRPICLLLALTMCAALSPRAGAAPPVPPPAVTEHWAKAEIIAAYELGLIDSWPAAPDTPILRRQAARLLADALGLSPSDGELPLTDVSATDPDRRWFVTVYNEGLFRGDDRKLLLPDEPLTRAEFAAIIARSGTGMLGEQREAVTFPDMREHWANRDVAAAYRLGLVNGVGDGLFDPQRSVTLAETLTMVVRMIDGTAGPAATLAKESDLTDLAILDLELWARAYSQTPVPDWTAVCANRVGVALFIMKESAAVEDAYRRQGHSGVAMVKSASAQVISSKPLSAVVTMTSTGVSVWDGVAEEITDVSDVYLRRVKGRWMIYKSLGR